MKLSKNIAGIAIIAASMAAMGENSFNATSEVEGFTSSKPQLKGGLYSNTIMTAKQLKARAKNKRAKQARKVNRN